MMLLVLLQESKDANITSVIQAGLSVESIAEAVFLKHCTHPEQIVAMYELDFTTSPEVPIPIFRYVGSDDAPQWYVPQGITPEMRGVINDFNRTNR